MYLQRRLSGGFGLWVLPPRRCPWRGVEDRAWCPADTTAWLRHYYGDDLRAPWRWRAWSALKGKE